jgi:hypothetical protein
MNLGNKKKPISEKVTVTITGFVVKMVPFEESLYETAGGSGRGQNDQFQISQGFPMDDERFAVFDVRFQYSRTRTNQ